MRRLFKEKKHGFTILETLVVIAIIGIMAAVILASLNDVRKKGRDAKRKIEITQIGRLLSAGSCYVPNAGPGEYDLMVLVPELTVKYPQLSQYITMIPKDPSGNETESKYMYIVNAVGKCAVFANLENADEPVTLPGLSGPTPGGGTGVLEASSSGWNGTPKYFQVSN